MWRHGDDYMNPITIQGLVDEQHRLTAIVPDSIPPGPVTVSLATSQEDDAGVNWAGGVSRQWTDELSDSRQDIYTLADGEAVDPA